MDLKGCSLTLIYETLDRMRFQAGTKVHQAAAALPLTRPGRVAIPTVNAPDLQKEAAKRKA
jgi:hypothetical protein